MKITAIILLCIFTAISLNFTSCNKRNIPDTSIVNSKPIILSIEELVRNKTIILEGNTFVPTFINKVWSCNLPNSSIDALSNGFIEKSRVKASNDKDDWTYAGRYGYTEEIEVSNTETNILYWENENESKIWSFVSTNIELEIIGIKPIGKNIQEIVKTSTLPSAIKGNVVEYENNDFIIKLIFDNSICIKVEFENFI